MFQGARLKLTIWYLLIIMTISVSFSVVIYKVSTNEVERYANLERERIERRLANPIYNFLPSQPVPILMDPSLVEETEQRLLINLILLNLGIAVIAGSGAYFLAAITLKPIKEMVEEQNRFISDASHELGTPLTSLKTAMEVYLRGKTKSISESTTLIKESILEVNKLETLSRSLLELSQYQKPKITEDFRPFDLKEAVKTAIHKINPIAKEKEIAIKSDLKEIKLVGNKDSIAELVVILLDNAIKYSVKKSKVFIKTQKANDYAIISVKDNGIGIEKEDIPHIFDRFYRSDTARSKNGSNGYGLGLSIARKIIDTHHGKISVESTPGNGSTFKVALPIGEL